MNESNPFGAMVAFWIFMQVVWTLLILGGGFYVLWCLNRIASSVERLAEARSDTSDNTLNDDSDEALWRTPLAPIQDAPLSEQSPLLPQVPSSTRDGAPHNFTSNI